MESWQDLWVTRSTLMRCYSHHWPSSQDWNDSRPLFAVHYVSFSLDFAVKSGRKYLMLVYLCSYKLALDIYRFKHSILDCCIFFPFFFAVHRIIYYALFTLIVKNS